MWGRREEEEITHLHLDVQNHHFSALCQIRNGHLARAVPVPAELRILYEFALLNHLLKLFHRDVVVIDTSLLARPGIARRVRDGGREDIWMPAQ